MADINKNVNVKVKWDNKEASKGVGQLGSTLNKTKKKSVGFFKTFKANWMGITAAVTGVVFAVKKVIDTINNFVKAAVKQRQAMNKLQAISKSVGLSFEETKKAAKSLSADGLMPFAESAQALSNLLATGLNLPKAIELLETAKDNAVTNRQAHLSLSEAVVKFTEGIRNENSMLTDSVGITKNYAAILKDEAKERGVNVNAITKQQKALLIANGFIKEGAAFSGQAAMASDRFAGQSAKLTTKIEILKAAIGERLIPVMKGMISIVSPLVGVFVKLFKKEDSLKDVTDELIKSSREYAEITKTLADESANLTEKERGKLEVRKAELKLKIVESLTLANKLYKEQNDLIPQLSKNIKHYEGLQKKAVKNVKALEARTFKYNGVIAEGATKQILLNKWIGLYRYNLKNAANTQIELTKRTTAYEGAIDTLAIGLKNKLITEAELLGLDEKLIESAKEKAKVIILTEDGITEKKTKSIKKIKELRELDTEEKAELQLEIDEAEKVTDEEMLEHKLAMIYEELESETLKKDEKIRLAQEAADIIDEIQTSALTKWIKKNKDAFDVLNGIRKQSFEVADMYYEQEIAGTENAVKNKTMSEKAGAKKIAELKLKQAKMAKATAIIDTVINTATAIMKAYSVLDPISASIAAAFIGGLGITKLNMIKNQPLPEVPKFEFGGKVKSKKPILVGEAGPEVFMPENTGNIIPNNKVLDSFPMAGELSAFANAGSITNNESNDNRQTKYISFADANIVIQTNDVDDMIDQLVDRADDMGSDVFIR